VIAPFRLRPIATARRPYTISRGMKYFAAKPVRSINVVMRDDRGRPVDPPGGAVRTATCRGAEVLSIVRPSGWAPSPCSSPLEATSSQPHRRKSGFLPATLSIIPLTKILVRGPFSSDVDVVLDTSAARSRTSGKALRQGWHSSFLLSVPAHRQRITDPARLPAAFTLIAQSCRGLLAREAHRFRQVQGIRRHSTAAGRKPSVALIDARDRPHSRQNFLEISENKRKRTRCERT